MTNLKILLGTSTVCVGLICGVLARSPKPADPGAVDKAKVEAATNGAVRTVEYSAVGGPSSAIETILNAAYQGKSGYGLSQKDEDRTKAGFNRMHYTYGEILPSSVSYFIKELKIAENDVFLDIGSGIGRMVIQVALEAKVKAARGVELSSYRHEQADVALAEIQKQGALDGKSVVNFINDDIFNVNLRDVTVVFANSLCYDEPFMDRLGAKLRDELPRGARVLTTKEFKPAPGKFELLATYTGVPMSWSKDSGGSTVYLYGIVG